MSRRGSWRRLAAQSMWRGFGRSPRRELEGSLVPPLLGGGADLSGPGRPGGEPGTPEAIEPLFCKHHIQTGGALVPALTSLPKIKQ